MKRKSLIISSAALFLVTACNLLSGLSFRTVTGSGHIVTENRDVTGFDRVTVCCGMQLYLSQGKDESLEIEADDNFMDQIETTVSDGILRIQYRETNNFIYRPSQPVHLKLTAPAVHSISLSGGGGFTAGTLDSQQFKLDLSGGSEGWVDSLQAEDVEISISGGGEFTAGRIDTSRIIFEFSGGSNADVDDLTAVHLYLDNSGGGKAVMSGSIKDGDINLSGGSSFDAGDLESQEMDFSSSGGGDSTIWVTHTLQVDLSGGSSLRYYGQPEDFQQNLSGGSVVKAMGEH